MSASSSDFVSGHSPESWSRSAVASLSEDARRRYEQLCDGAEASLRAGRSPSEIAETLDAGTPVRELVLLNLARCWLETRVGDPAAVETILSWLPELARCREAAADLRAEASMASDLDGHPFELISDTHELIKEFPTKA